MPNLKRKNRMKDSISIAITGGVIGTIFMSVANWLMYKAGKTELLYEQITGQFFFSPHKTKQGKNMVLGEVLHLGVGAFFGLPIFLMLKITGKDKLLLKGLFGGMTTWGLLYAGGQKIGLFKKPRFTKTHYTAVFNNALYGVAAAQAMVALADPKVFASTEKDQIRQPNQQTKCMYNADSDYDEHDASSQYAYLS